MFCDVYIRSPLTVVDCVVGVVCRCCCKCFVPLVEAILCFTLWREPVRTFKRGVFLLVTYIHCTKLTLYLGHVTTVGTSQLWFSMDAICTMMEF